MVRAFAINGSPRKARGNTALILAPFLAGMEEAGTEVDLIYPSELKIEPCIGNMHCWYEKPGECIHKDAMQDLYPRLRAAETLVLATPVYIPLPGKMQDAINRLCPLVEPLLVTREGRTRARFRDDVAIRRIVLVASSGWWELGNFGTVVRIVEELAADTCVPFAGAVLRPHASVMRREREVTADGQAVLDAARKAGYELASEGRMRRETLEAVSRPLISQEVYTQHLNQQLRLG